MRCCTNDLRVELSGIGSQLLISEEQLRHKVFQPQILTLQLGHQITQCEFCLIQRASLGRYCHGHVAHISPIAS